MNTNIFQDYVNQMALAAAAIILALTVYVAGKYIKQMKTDKSTGELTDENWDGIGEYKNELPAGWAYTFLGTMIWALWYWTVGYPVDAYSQIG
jgi:cytochrome c oxidase cbb3-type subunit 3